MYADSIETRCLAVWTPPFSLIGVFKPRIFFLWVILLTPSSSAIQVALPIGHLDEFTLGNKLLLSLGHSCLSTNDGKNLSRTWSCMLTLRQANSTLVVYREGHSSWSSSPFLSTTTPNVQTISSICVGCGTWLITGWTTSTTNPAGKYCLVLFIQFACLS